LHTQNAHLRPRAALHRHRYRSYKKNFESQARRDLSIGVISRPGVGISPPGARDGFIYCTQHPQRLVQYVHTGSSTLSSAVLLSYSTYCSVGLYTVYHCIYIQYYHSTAVYGSAESRTAVKKVSTE
jgi:hypothetical protein